MPNSSTSCYINCSKHSNMGIKRRCLYLFAALLWGAPGVMITAKGVGAYADQPRGDLWWLLPITAVVLMGFYFMFRRIVGRYTSRIAALPEDGLKLWHTFPTRGWVLLVFMMCLGMALRFVPGVPVAFTASFYSGLGPMLLLSVVRFVARK